MSAYDVFAYLNLLAEQGGSDMYFSVGAIPQVKVEGISKSIGKHRLPPSSVQQMAYQLMTQKQVAEFERDLEMNLAVGVKGSGRFRVNVFYQRGEVSMVVRLINRIIPDFSSLGLPPVLERLSMLSRGLILVTGAACSGKSTTLAAMLDYRNTHAGGHILCIEDPIEFLHKHKQSVINQREVGLDTHSFADALHNALREAPDVIMIGEIRDLDTMQHALHYSETGHLCVATLHATSTPHALERIVRFFPEHARSQVLADVAQNLVGIIGQRLIPGIKQKRVAAIEMMLATPYIKDLIQRDQLDELKSAIARSQEQGLQTFDQELLRLYQAGSISLEEALKFADSRTDLTLKVKLDSGFAGNVPDTLSIK